MPEETNIERLIVNILTQEQYDAMKLAGEINENELYLTPSEDSGSLGDLSTLTTTIKTSLVAAINEVNGRITTELGNIETVLEGIVMSIADKITRLTNARNAIRTALISKGILASDHGFEDFAEDIGDISTGYPEPTGTKEITENGTGIDVKDYADVDVNVPPTEYTSYPFKENGTVVVEDGVTKISEAWCFASQLIENLYLPTTLLSTMTAVFNSTDVINLHIEDLENYLNVAFGLQGGQPLREVSITSDRHRRHIFLNGNELTNVTIPDGVTRLYDNVFANCVNITSMTISNTVKKLGVAIIPNTPITFLKIPATVEEIGIYCFRGTLRMTTFDFTEFSLVDGALPITFGSNCFDGIIRSNAVILFATQEIAEVAKQTTNLAPYASYIHYVGEETV